MDQTVFDNSALPYVIGVIYPAQLTAPGSVTVAFPHVAVPKNFHVALAPSSSSSGLTATFSVRGDSEATRVRTPDNTHSTFIAVNLSSQQVESGVIDGNITFVGQTSPIFSNLYITAYVQTGSAAVRTPGVTPAVSLYPNPSSTFIEISNANASGSSRIEIVDVIGRQMLSSELPGDGKLDVRRLPPGRYEAIIHSTNGEFTRPVVITR